VNPADRDRKKAWKEQERKKAQTAFPLPSELLESLFTSVETRVGEKGCDHTYRFTDRWLSEHKQPRASVLEWLEEHGGFCDCEVVANARNHREQNR
jgi:hypothetical protein